MHVLTLAVPSVNTNLTVGEVCTGKDIKPNVQSVGKVVVT